VPLVEAHLVEELLEQVGLQVVLDGLVLVLSRLGHLILDEFQLAVLLFLLLFVEELVQANVQVCSLLFQFLSFELLEAG